MEPLRLGSQAKGQCCARRWKKDTTERGTSARMLAEAAKIRAGVGPRGIVARDRIEAATAPVSAPPPPAPAPPSGGGAQP